ncbi:MAG: glycoside hydrolase family 16 protein, partial [Flavobacteriales bacterium]
NVKAQCKLDKSNYNLVFSEEFNAQSDISTLSANWHFVPTNTLGVPLPGNMHGPESKVVNKPENLDLTSHPGNLTITTKKLNTPYYVNINGVDKLVTYESGWLESKKYYDAYCPQWQHNGFAYGMFEARIKLPAGFVWPAFWLTDHCVTEIDIVEAGDFPQSDYLKRSTNNVIYWPGCGYPNPKKSCQQIWNYGIDLSADFHTYTCVWTPNEVSFFFDGKLMRTVSTNVVKTVQCPASIIVGTGAFATANPTLEALRVPIGSEYKMLVDYIRVYKPKNLDYSQSYFLNEPQFVYTDITEEAGLQLLSSQKPNSVSGVKIAPNPLNEKEVFYCGQDNRLYIASDLNGYWKIEEVNCTNGSYPNVAGPINFSKVHNALYYVANDNK